MSHETDTNDPYSQVKRAEEAGVNRPVVGDSERIAGSANSQGDTDEDTRIRAGVVPGENENDESEG